MRPVRDGLEEGDETIEIELLPTDAYSLPIVTETSIALVDSD